MNARPLRIVLVTVSDGVSAGEREDRGGPACETALRDCGIAHEVVSRGVLPDDRHRRLEKSPIERQIGSECWRP